MSYVRVGKNSDVYLYGGKDALELIVANNAGSAGNVPYPKKGGSAKEFEAWLDDVIPLDHPDAGKSYTFTSRQACIDKLKELGKTGLKVPHGPIERLEQEIKEEGDVYI